MKVENSLKKTSIRGRFAIGLQSLKYLLRESNLHWVPEIRASIEKYGKFTSSEKLDIWEDEIKAYKPNHHTSWEEIIEYLFNKNKYYNNVTRGNNRENYYKNIHLEVKDKLFYTELLKYYQSMNSQLIDAFELCEGIALGNIYASTHKHSEVTLRPLLDILSKNENLMNEFDFEFISRKYPFYQNNGWGEVFDFSQFKRKSS